MQLHYQLKISPAQHRPHDPLILKLNHSLNNLTSNYVCVFPIFLLSHLSLMIPSQTFLKAGQHTGALSIRGFGMCINSLDFRLGIIRPLCKYCYHKCQPVRAPEIWAVAKPYQTLVKTLFQLQQPRCSVPLSPLLRATQVQPTLILSCFFPILSYY